MGGRRKMLLASGLALLALALLSAPTSAECPNGCSGNGACMNKDMCQCYKNYQGNDCMDRTCQFGYAHADTPKGDINYDQSRATMGWILPNSQQAPASTYEYFNPDAANDEAHFYMECSNKGLCDRSLGVCTCFDGYEGVACQRAACPNKCSGHGTCESIRELGLKTQGTLFGIPSYWDKITYDLWDSRVTYGCRCDPWYHGADCSLRSCKVGVDPMFLSLGTAVYETFAVHVYTTATTTDLTETALTAGTNYFRLRLFDYHGESYITDPIAISNEYYYAKSALLLNAVVTQAMVDAAVDPIKTTLANLLAAASPNNVVTQDVIDAVTAAYTANAKANAAAVAAAIKKVPNHTFKDVLCEPTGAFVGDSLSGYKSGRAAASRGLSVVCQFTNNPGRLRQPEVAAYDFTAVIDPSKKTYKLSTLEDGRDDEWFTVDSGVVVTAKANDNVALSVTGGSVQATPTLFKLGSYVVVGTMTTTTIALKYPLVHAIGTTTKRFDVYSATGVTTGFAVTELAIKTGGTPVDQNFITVVPTFDPGFSPGDLVFYENQFYRWVSTTTTTAFTPAVITPPSAATAGEYKIYLDRPFVGNSVDRTDGTVLLAYKVTPPKSDYMYNYVSPCSGRGLCTTETGICACFKGYTNDNCNTQNILAL